MDEGLLAQLAEALLKNGVGGLLAAAMLYLYWRRERELAAKAEAEHQRQREERAALELLQRHERSTLIELVQRATQAAETHAQLCGRLDQRTFELTGVVREVRDQLQRDGVLRERDLLSLTQAIKDTAPPRVAYLRAGENRERP